MKLIYVLSVTLVCIGCGRTGPGVENHEHHDVAITKKDVKMPETFHELVSRVGGYRDQIKTAIDAGKPEEAHRALDELDFVLDETMPLAQKAVPEDRLEKINQAKQSLRNAFRELHQSIDAKEKPDYASRTNEIEAAINSLKQSAENSTNR